MDNAIQRHRQQLAQDTERRENKNTTQKTKKIINTGLKMTR